MEINQALDDVKAAAFLGLAPQTLRNLRCRCAGPPYHKIGRRVVYLKQDLELYLRERRVDPEAREAL